jgi:3-oxosteroid 1-dehydrogenase
VTDEYARVIGQDDRPIGGLYATGNSTATVMGRHYLGPGASIANSMVFGYVAARHASMQLGAVAPNADGLARTLSRGGEDRVL